MIRLVLVRDRRCCIAVAAVAIFSDVPVRPRCSHRCSIPRTAGRWPRCGGTLRTRLAALGREPVLVHTFRILGFVQIRLREDLFCKGAARECSIPELRSDR